MHYDVIIVGGGPSGAACATVLARRGIRVLVCDKAKFPRDKICGECINPQCWPLLGMLGVDEAVRRRYTTIIDRVEIHSADGKKISVHPDNRRYLFLAMARREFDSLLLRNAEEQGADIIEQGKVVAINYDACWRVSVERQGRRVFSSEYLVGADGRNSIVGRTVSNGLQTSRSISGSDRVGIQWHTEFQEALGNTLMMFLFPGGYFGAVNVTDNVANIAMVVSRKLAQLLPADFSGFLEKTVMSNAVARSELASFQPFSNPATTFPINPAIHCSRYASAFLIGDARRTVEPFTGRGILVALWDGIRKGQELTALISGQRQHIERLVRRSWAEPVLSFVLRNPRFGGGLVSASTMVPVLRNSVARAIFGQNSAS